MIEITKDTIIGDILDVAPQTAPIFLSIGMHCLGCPSSRGETVEEACAVHRTGGGGGAPAPSPASTWTSCWRSSTKRRTSPLPSK